MTLKVVTSSVPNNLETLALGGLMIIKGLILLPDKAKDFWSFY